MICGMKKLVDIVRTDDDGTRSEWRWYLDDLTWCVEDIATRDQTLTLYRTMGEAYRAWYGRNLKRWRELHGRRPADPWMLRVTDIVALTCVHFDVPLVEVRRRLWLPGVRVEGATSYSYEEMVSRFGATPSVRVRRTPAELAAQIGLDDPELARHIPIPRGYQPRTGVTYTGVSLEDQFHLVRRQ